MKGIVIELLKNVAPEVAEKMAPLLAKIVGNEDYYNVLAYLSDRSFKVEDFVSNVQDVEILDSITNMENSLLQQSMVVLFSDANFEESTDDDKTTIVAAVKEEAEKEEVSKQKLQQLLKLSRVVPYNDHDYSNYVDTVSKTDDVNKALNASRVICDEKVRLYAGENTLLLADAVAHANGDVQSYYASCLARNIAVLTDGYNAYFNIVMSVAKQTSGRKAVNTYREVLTKVKR